MDKQDAKEILNVLYFKEQIKQKQTEGQQGGGMTYEWHKTKEELPTEEKEYLCCIKGKLQPYFKVMSWSNNLYIVDKYDFYDKKGVSGFWDYDSEAGYYKSDCDYWAEIELPNPTI